MWPQSIHVVLTLMAMQSGVMIWTSRTTSEELKSLNFHKTFEYKAQCNDSEVSGATKPPTHKTHSDQQLKVQIV